MKIKTIFSTSILVLAVFGCAKEEDLAQVEPTGEVQRVTVLGPAPIQFEAITGSPETKGTSIQDGSALLFNWEMGDTLGIFPNKGNQVEFPISASEGSTSASFDGGGWALRNNASYAAYYPFSVWNYHRDNETIVLDYSGQEQDGNGSFAHLSKYDFLASDKTTPQNSAVTFQMERQGSILYIDIVVPEPETIKSLTISCDEAIFVEKAALNISGAEPAVTPLKTTESLTLSFKNTATTTNNETVRAYMAVQPVDFTQKTVTATLTTESGSYTAPVTSRVVNKGRAAFLRFSGDFTPVNIDFADAEVKRICVENWDTNGDGELSYKEAAAVTDLGVAFRASYESPNTSVTSFNELQYFTGLSEIGEYAFSYCTKLMSITLPETIEKLGCYAFQRCPFEHVLLPESLLDIDHEVFESLTTIHIPRNVRSINRTSGLYGCPLSGITVDADNPYFCAKDGVLFNKDMTKLICYPMKKEGVSYSVPSGVSIIGSCAFYSTKLTEVLFPESLRVIEGSAFRYARRLSESLVLPSGLLEIGWDTFQYCESLSSITIPASVTSIGNAMCNGTNLQEFEVESESAFYKSVDGVLFDYSGEILVNYPNGKEVLSYLVPQGTTTIGRRAFEYNNHLTTVTIPDSVTSIKGYAFFACNSISSITCLATIPPNMEYEVFKMSNNSPIYVPNESVEAYKAAPGWSEYADRIVGIDVEGTVVGPEPQNPD